jgi:hypothetical protein
VHAQLGAVAVLTSVSNVEKKYSALAFTEEKKIREHLCESFLSLPAVGFSI